MTSCKGWVALGRRMVGDRGGGPTFSLDPSVFLHSFFKYKQFYFGNMNNYFKN